MREFIKFVAHDIKLVEEIFFVFNRTSNGVHEPFNGVVRKFNEDWSFVFSIFI
jgi:hypothetical protein